MRRRHRFGPKSRHRHFLFLQVVQARQYRRLPEQDERGQPEVALIPLADEIENKLSPQYRAVAVADLD